MTAHPEPLRAQRDELLSVLNTAGTLAGLCVTVVAFMNSIRQADSGATIVDDLFAVSAVLFLLCIYSGFWGIRAQGRSVGAVVLRTTDCLFLLALTVMVIAALLMLYTLW